MNDPSLSSAPSVSRREALGVLAALACSAGVAPSSSEAAAVGSSDFDFLVGRWAVRHRRLRERLKGSIDWIVYDGTLAMRKLPGAIGNIDENRLNAPDGPYDACSLRLYDATRGTWSIYWIDGRGPGIDAPLVGRFKGREGQFFNDDLLDGQAIRVRFTYRDLAPDRAQWDQAFSADSGTTWEVNWTMDMTRTG